MKNIHIGDKVNIDGIEGIVVCSIDNKEYTKKYSEDDWSYLRKGILVETKEMGLIHFENSKFFIIEKNKL